MFRQGAASPSLAQPKWVAVSNLMGTPGPHTLGIPAATNAARYFRLQ